MKIRMQVEGLRIVTLKARLNNMKARLNLT